jgi:hypothetical protein
MMSKKHALRLLTVSLLFTVIGSLSAVSMMPQNFPSDPYRSEALLEQTDFFSPDSREDGDDVDFLEISLVTMGRGDPLYVWFGHTALVVTHTVTNRSVMYDYGIFSFSDDFYRTFALGRLFYEVWTTSAPARYDLAREEDRTITSLSLSLAPDVKKALVQFLNYNIQEPQNTYLYHHYRENCSTRIRDILNAATDGQLKTWATAIGAQATIRQLVNRHTYSDPLIYWVLNFLQSGCIDSPASLWEAMFLPAVLEEAVAEFSYTDRNGTVTALAESEETLYTATAGIRAETATENISLTGKFALIALAAALLSIMSGRLMPKSRFTTIRRTGMFVYGLFTLSWTLAGGLLATLLLFMMAFSSHDVTYFNENIVFVSPWLLIMSVQIIRGLRGNQTAMSRFRRANTALAILALALVVMKGVLNQVLIQDNWLILVTMVPLYVANSTIDFERITRWGVPKIDDAEA